MAIIPGIGEIDAEIQKKQRQDFIADIKAKNLEKLNPGLVEDNFKYIKEQGKTWKDEFYDFNNHMERAVPFSFKPEDLTSQQDISENVIERGSISSDKFGAVSLDKIVGAITDSAQITGTLAGSTTLNDGQQAVITISLDDAADVNRIMHGVCHITAYHTALSGSNIIPYGASTTPVQWRWANKADWNSNDNKKSTWIDYILNLTAGASTPVLWRAAYRYMGRVAKEGA